MEFLAKPQLPPLKNLYPCLATITVTPAGRPENKSRRLSSSSGGGDEENPLKRVMSGGRRKSSFGAIAVSGGGSGDGAKKSGEYQPTGTWYWRVQAGVSDVSGNPFNSVEQKAHEGYQKTHLVLLPLTQPANALLTTPPALLSSAMPAHSTAHNASDPAVIKANKDESLGTKIGNLFRRPSSTATPTNPADRRTSATTNNTANTGNTGSTDQTAVDAVLDQTSRGEQLPSAAANAMGATNVNSSAEMGWPGQINGDRLGAVMVDLHGVEEGKVTLGGGKKGEGSWVLVPVSGQSHLSIQNSSW